MSSILIDLLDVYLRPDIAEMRKTFLEQLTAARVAGDAEKLKQIRETLGRKYASAFQEARKCGTVN